MTDGMEDEFFLPGGRLDDSYRKGPTRPLRISNHLQEEGFHLDYLINEAYSEEF
jgi:hypothetical protein